VREGLRQNPARARYPERGHPDYAEARRIIADSLTDRVVKRPLEPRYDRAVTRGWLTIPQRVTTAWGGLGARVRATPSAVRWLRRQQQADDAEGERSQVGLFANPRRASEVQSVLVPTDRFTARQAVKWVRDHGFRAAKIDTTDNYHRFRQFPPSKCHNYRTITLDSTDGVKAVLCVPRR
jgi:hypothetical protein